MGWLGGGVFLFIERVFFWKGADDEGGCSLFAPSSLFLFAFCK
jgi:hypothetical protein